MSAAQQTMPEPQPQPQRKQRVRRTKAQIKAAMEKGAQTRARNQAAKAQDGVTQFPTPSGQRAAGMKQRAQTTTTKAQSPNEIAAGFAAQLKSAGPGWSAEYQKTFLAGLTHALPVICAPIA